MTALERRTCRGPLPFARIKRKVETKKTDTQRQTEKK